MYSNWSYSPETLNLGQIRRFLEPCDLEIWRMSLKNNRAPLLCSFQLCAWFHCHMWIQTGVRVRKRLSWVLTSVTLTFDLWPWPFAWTSLLTMVITPENFMMIRWWEHGEKGVTDRRTDRQTENTICRAAWSQLKKNTHPYFTMVRLWGVSYGYFGRNWLCYNGNVLYQTITGKISRTWVTLKVESKPDTGTIWR